MTSVTSDVRIMRDGRKEATIDASSRDPHGRPVDQQTLNEEIRRVIAAGAGRISVTGVMGQRYIASACTDRELYIRIDGTPGNGLGAFLDGPTIEVFGNAQDMTGNTMACGRIIVHGNAWDVTGLAARGGRILIRDSSGYRVGIHMKEYGGSAPSIIIGGQAGDYLGEYMAGGSILVLGNGCRRSPVGSSIGAGMHGGSIYVRGPVEKHQLGIGAALQPLDDTDRQRLEDMISDFERCFSLRVTRNWPEYLKIAPLSSRPFCGHFDPIPI